MQYRTAFQVSAIKNRYHPPISSNAICTCLKGLTMATRFPTDTGRGTSLLGAYPIIYRTQHKSKIRNECLTSWLMNEIRRAAHPKQKDKRIRQSAPFSPNPYLTSSERQITTEIKLIFQKQPPVTCPHTPHKHSIFLLRKLHEDLSEKSHVKVVLKAWEWKRLVRIARSTVSHLATWCNSLK